MHEESVGLFSEHAISIWLELLLLYHGLSSLVISSSLRSGLSLSCLMGSNGGRARIAVPTYVRAYQTLFVSKSPLVKTYRRGGHEQKEMIIQSAEVFTLVIPQQGTGFLLEKNPSSWLSYNITRKPIKPYLYCFVQGFFRAKSPRIRSYFPQDWQLHSRSPMMSSIKIKLLQVSIIKFAIGIFLPSQSMWL